MLIYWFQLVASGWHEFTEALGSTTLGFWLQVSGLPLVTFLVTVAVVGLRDGRHRIMAHLNGSLFTRAIVIAILADMVIYGPILGEKILRAAYQDHQNLAGQALSVEKSRDAQRQQDLAEWVPVKTSLESQLQAQIVTCAGLSGENRTLNKQSKDQQTLIAGCQEDAIRRLAPEPQKLTVLELESAVTAEEHSESLILLTNKEVYPCPDNRIL